MHDSLAIGPGVHVVSMQCLYTRTQKEILCVVAPVYMANSSGHLVTMYFHYTIDFCNSSEEFEEHDIYDGLRSMVVHHCR